MAGRCFRRAMIVIFVGDCCVAWDASASMSRTSGHASRSIDNRARFTFFMMICSISYMGFLTFVIYSQSLLLPVYVTYHINVT